MSKNHLASLPPFVQGRSIENSRWYMGNVMTFLVNSEQTAGAFGMTEYLSKPGNEPPAHVHGRHRCLRRQRGLLCGPERRSVPSKVHSAYIQDPHSAIANADLDVSGQLGRILPRYERSGPLPRTSGTPGELW